MAFMGDEALEMLWTLFKERLSQEEQVYKTIVSAEAQEEGAAVMTVEIQRQFQVCVGRIFIPKDNTEDTVTLPAGFRPAADYAMTDDGFTIGTGGAVVITTANIEDRSLVFCYFTDNSPPDMLYAAGGDEENGIAD